MKTFLLTLLIGFSTICGGCIALSHYLTPADLDGKAIDFVTDAGVADANKYDGYANLHKAGLLKEDVETAYKLNQFELQKAAEKNNLDYSIVAETTATNYTAALEREGELFGPEGGLATILGIAGLSGATGLLGLMRKRPGDITPQEASAAIADATGASQAELEAKITQFNQVVKGVSQFKRVLDEKAGNESNCTVKVADLATELIKEMKSTFNASQDAETQKAVAVSVKS